MTKHNPDSKDRLHISQKHMTVHAGFDVGGTSVKAGLFSDETEKPFLLTKRSVPFPGADYRKLALCVKELTCDMLAEQGLTERELASVGAAVPGSLDRERSLVIDASNLGYHNAPIKQAISEFFPGVPVYLENDANAAALAELYAGAFRGAQTAVLLTLGTGVGGGIILNGRLFDGGMGHGIELGHMCLIHGGALCSCGNRGCIETVCAATWLSAQGRNALCAGDHGELFRRTNGDPDHVSAEIVIESAKAGDAAAEAIFCDYVDHLSSAVLSVIALLDPEVVAIGGGVSLAGDFLFQPLREKVNEGAFYPCEYRIVPAELGNDAGIAGAAMLHRMR